MRWLCPHERTSTTHTRSVNPIVQISDNTQNLNRYNFVWANSLSYIDSPGFIFLRA